MTLDEIRDLGRQWMRASLTERPASEEQKRRVRILLRTNEAKAS